jgi:tetrahydromethanopterin S-methyltransferase subunit G
MKPEKKEYIKKWLDKNHEWNKTYKRLKHQNDRNDRRNAEMLKELEEVHDNLNKIKSKVGFLIGRLRKTFQ